MVGVTHVILLLVAFIRTESTTIVNSEYPWLSLPPTPRLPLPINGQYLRIDNVMLWYSVYGSNQRPTVLFLHGGFANSNYWGLQIKKLRSKYRCILMDSRGHGRSSLSADNITYDLMTSDVIALLDHLGIEKTNIVGWSDGAIIGLNIAMKYPSRLNSLFAFGASYNPQGIKDISSSAVFMAYLSRTQTEYEAMNPTNDFQNFSSNLFSMWSTLPNWSSEDFSKINRSIPIWIVDGDHEEGVYREHTDQIAAWIQQAGELILPGSSHFSFIQTPQIFTLTLRQFLKMTNPQTSNSVALKYSPVIIMLASFLFQLSF